MIHVLIVLEPKFAKPLGLFAGSCDEIGVIPVSLN